MTLHEYHETCFKLSRKLTNEYSTSFSLGIKAFSPEFRGPIYGIYGYVRVADEIVDTFDGHDKKKLLQDFRTETYKAINEGISTNPILNSFQIVVKKYGITNELIDAFLHSMEMDLYESSYERNEYDNYIFGSAEVVGLMCLKVFCKGDENLYNKLEYSAKMLGSAFQKVNFLRDIKSDLDDRKRIYLPDVHDQSDITDLNKKVLEEEVEKEFQEALKGILQLPDGVKLGVYSAFQYYYGLFNKIRKLSVTELLSKRVRIPNYVKLGLLFKSIFEVKVFKTA